MRLVKSRLCLPDIAQLLQDSPRREAGHRGGAYVNMFMDEGEERVKAAYRDNYARLAQIKARYDPTNFFHMNQNIRVA